MFKIIFLEFSMTYTTIRIPVDAHKLVKELSAKTKLAQQVVLERALKIFEEQQFWEECRIAYENLSNNTTLLAAEKEETELWENTLDKCF